MEWSEFWHLFLTVRTDAYNVRPEAIPIMNCTGILQRHIGANKAIGRRTVGCGVFNRR